MDKNLINSHDRFFKQLFSGKEEVSEFVAKTFPTELTQKLDLKTLELDKTEYVDKKLKTSKESSAKNYFWKIVNKQDFNVFQTSGKH